MKWAKVRLGDISNYRKSKILSNLLNEKNYISTDNILANREGITLSVYVPTNGKINEFLENDILISNIRPYFKKIYFAEFNGGCSNDILVFATTNKNIDSKFLYYQLSKDDFFDYMMSGANGTKMPRGNKKSILDYSFLLPPLKTQKKIAKILSNYDDLIENNLKQIKLLEEKARLTYEEWFLRFRVDGVELEIDSESGLPFGWEEKKIGNLCHISSSKRIFSSDYVDDGIPFYRGKEISLKSKNQSISDEYFISKQRFDEIDKKFGSPKKNDILITAVGTLGSIYLVKQSDGQFYFKDGNLIWLQKFLKDDFYYIFYLLKSEEFQGVLQNIAIGSSQKALTIKALNSVKIKYPLRSVIDDFNIVIEPILAQIENLNQQNQNLKEARDILLPRLMTGVIEP